MICDFRWQRVWLAATAKARRKQFLIFFTWNWVIRKEPFCFLFFFFWASLGLKQNPRWMEGTVFGSQPLAIHVHPLWVMHSWKIARSNYQIHDHVLFFLFVGDCAIENVLCKVAFSQTPNKLLAVPFKRQKMSNIMFGTCYTGILIYAGDIQTISL